jgi:hypothetical protein
MRFQIHFRGAAVFVHTDSTVTEVLFPNAETRIPPDGTKEKLFDPETGKLRLATCMRHADRTPAPQHIAGALLVRRSHSDTYRKLIGRQVRPEGEGNGPVMQGDFAHKIPALRNVIHEAHGLELLPPEDRVNAARVGTRFLLRGGNIYPELETEEKWILDSKFGTPAPEQFYHIGARWEVEVDGDRPSFTLAVNDLTGGLAEAPIVLDEETSEVYFYNYDVGMPTVAELNAPLGDTEAKEELVDHDFKWIYTLIDRDRNFTTWQAFLRGKPFPAPRLPGGPLIPVSTCFPTLWPA